MLTDSTVLVESRLGLDHVAVRATPTARRGRRLGEDEFGNERVFCAKCGHDERSGWVS